MTKGSKTAFSKDRLILGSVVVSLWAGMVQLVYRLSTGCTVRGLKHGGGEIFRARSDRAWGSHSLLFNGYWVLPGGKVARTWC